MLERRSRALCVLCGGICTTIVVHMCTFVRWPAEVLRSLCQNPFRNAAPPTMQWHGGVYIHYLYTVCLYSILIPYIQFKNSAFYMDVLCAYIHRRYCSVPSRTAPVCLSECERVSSSSFRAAHRRIHRISRVQIIRERAHRTAQARADP